MRPQLSVIIPIGPGRNGTVALRSLLNSDTLDGVEVIVVGDGHIPDISEEFRSLPICVHGLPVHSGANAVRNYGASMAKSEVLCFLDDDDAYLSGATETIKSMVELDRKKTDAWSLGAKMRSGRNLWWIRKPAVIREKTIWKRNKAGGCSSMVVRKEAFERIGGFDERFPSMQDWDLWLRLCSEGKVRGIRKALVVYDDRSKNRISSDFSARKLGLRMLYDKHADRWPKGVRSFHQARLAGLEMKSGCLRLTDLIFVRAPILSLLNVYRMLSGKYIDHFSL